MSLKVKFRGFPSSHKSKIFLQHALFCHDYNRSVFIISVIVTFRREHLSENKIRDLHP